jgi:hypothetical protein
MPVRFPRPEIASHTVSACGDAAGKISAGTLRFERVRFQPRWNGLDKLTSTLDNMSSQTSQIWEERHAQVSPEDQSRCRAHPKQQMGAGRVVR